MRRREELRAIAQEAYSQPVAARYERTLAKALLAAYDEAAELRERVESLGSALARLENWLEVTATYAVSKPKRDYAERTLKILRDDLSSAELANAQAKLESQEGKK